jgi:uncharacterized membrane protein YhaH (DUF805 family)
MIPTFSPETGAWTLTLLVVIFLVAVFVPTIREVIQRIKDWLRNEESL